ncbi:MAG: AAA family ATPase, partial [Clostridia bacterium]|nr:AAA family ATPase [Clostridia bacterium]
VGMPGCGKSTVGRALAQKEGRAFIDTDEEITKKTGRTPDEIIRQDGIEVFRDIESQVIEEISSANSAVISIGGGGILRERNAELLRMNGILVFLDCPIDLLTVSDDRPLSSTREALEQRYRERLPIYRRHADFTVESDKNLENNLKKIERELEKI